MPQEAITSSGSVTQSTSEAMSEPGILSKSISTVMSIFDWSGDSEVAAKSPTPEQASEQSNEPIRINVHVGIKKPQRQPTAEVSGNEISACSRRGPEIKNGCASFSPLARSKPTNNFGHSKSTSMTDFPGALDRPYLPCEHFRQGAHSMTIQRHHDMGGQDAGPVEPTEHDYALWEKKGGCHHPPFEQNRSTIITRR